MQKVIEQDAQDDKRWFFHNRDEYAACYEALAREERSGRMSPLRKRRLITLLQLFVEESQKK